MLELHSQNAYWARLVIVAYNSGNDLQTCIDSLSAQIFQNFEVIIVDNASSDAAVQELNLPNDRYRILRLDENMGFAGGSNCGADKAQTEWIITLNPDSWPQENWLEELYTASQENPTFTMLSSTIVQNDAPEYLDSFGDFFSIFGVARNAGRNTHIKKCPSYLCETFSPSGAAAAYRTVTFEAYGGFDTDFFCYMEDIDLGYRLRMMGERCLQCPKAIVHHIGSSSVGKFSDFKFYHSYKNNFAVILKNTPLLLLFLMVPLFLSSQLWWLFRNRKNVGHSARKKGVKEGLRLSCRNFRKRRVIQKNKVISSFTLAKCLSWSSKDLKASNFFYWPL